MTLHQLFNPHALHRIIAEEGDALMLLNDAVLLGLHSLAHVSQTVYARKAELDARGIADCVSDNIRIIDDAEWVALCAGSDKVIAWS